MHDKAQQASGAQYGGGGVGLGLGGGLVGLGGLQRLGTQPRSMRTLGGNGGGDGGGDIRGVAGDRRWLAVSCEW